MQFKMILNITLIIFGLGLVYKVSLWFSRGAGPKGKLAETSARIYAALRGTVATLFSPKIIKIFKVIILDVLWQSRILKESFLRWVMHMLIFWGFLLLLLMHALGSFIVAPLFGAYYSTLNPFFFLRDLFGVMVLVGLGIACYRRYLLKVPGLRTNSRDLYAIVIVAAIIVSGFFLEGMKISSPAKFNQMVEDYTGGLDESEMAALETVWVHDDGLSSAALQGPFDPSVLETGREINEENCAGCHVSAKWAFTGYTAAKIVGPIASFLDRLGGVDILWFVHIILCFAGLAWLPFSKMFHIITTPLSLMANAVMDENSLPPNMATRQAMELEACTHCGACSLNCSVLPVFKATGNELVLPSEKMVCLRQNCAKTDSADIFQAIQDGFYLCTNCERCTQVCPCGIGLKDIWFNEREALIQNGQPQLYALSGLSFYRGVRSGEIPGDRYGKPLALARKLIADACEMCASKETPIRLEYPENAFKKALVNSFQGKSVSLCFTCTSCTIECPVVKSLDNPSEKLGLLPHQIIRAAVLGFGEMAYNANMLWDCLGCYQCQDICPQNVHITEVFCELKNLAIEHFKQKTKITAPSGGIIK